MSRCQQVFQIIKIQRNRNLPYLVMYDPRSSPLHEDWSVSYSTTPNKNDENLPPATYIPGPARRVLLVCQAYPPLLKNAGGVAKRYLTLCRAMIDGLGWTVTIVTPVNVLRSGSKDVERWLHEGSLVYLPARGVSVDSPDGLAVFMDLFSAWNAMWLTHALTQHKPGYDVCVMDDVPWRIHLLLLMRAFGVPTVVTSHTDATHIKSYKMSSIMRTTWKVHMASAHVADVHASVSHVFGKILQDREGTPVNAYWPPILWSNEFRADPQTHYVQESKTLRAEWSKMIEDRDGFIPRVIFLFAGRWAGEKRILKLFRCVPDGCALIIVGDGTSNDADQIAAGTDIPLQLESTSVAMDENNNTTTTTSTADGTPIPIRGVLPLRKMLDATELRTAYQACDVFVSASAFETLGNTVVEALCCGTPVAVQPAQGHLEYVVEGENSYFVDFDDAVEAKRKLTEIAQSIEKKQFPPKLKALGKRFRESNFALEFHNGVLQPAFDAREGRDYQHSKCKCCCETLLIRPLALLTWILSWFIMRCSSRCIYTCSKNPSFVILDELGGSIENPKKKKQMRRPPGSEDDLTTMRGLYRAAHLKVGVDLKKKKKV